MDISFIRQHRLGRTNELRKMFIVLDMSTISSSASTSAGVTVGKEFATAQISSNVVTLTYIEPLENAPYVIAFAQSPDDTGIDVGTCSTTSLVLTMLKKSDHSSAITTGVIALDLSVPVGLTTL